MAHDAISKRRCNQISQLWCRIKLNCRPAWCCDYKLHIRRVCWRHHCTLRWADSGYKMWLLIKRTRRTCYGCHFQMWWQSSQLHFFYYHVLPRILTCCMLCFIARGYSYWWYLSSFLSSCLTPQASCALRPYFYCGKLPWAFVWLNTPVMSTKFQTAESAHMPCEKVLSSFDLSQW